jgi:hypothetical protein
MNDVDLEKSYHLPCGTKTLRAAKEAAVRGKYMHLIESYATRKSSPHYVACLNLTFVPKVFRVAFSIDAYDHAKEMAIYAAYLMEKVAYGDNFPQSEYDRKLEQISKLTANEVLVVNDSSADKLETIYKHVNNRMLERELKKNRLVRSMAIEYENIKSEIDDLVCGNHNRLTFIASNKRTSRKYTHVGVTKQFKPDSRWYAELSIQQKDVQLTTRISFLTRTYGASAKPLAIYAAYLMEKTVYGTSIPGGEYEAKMLEILKLTRDDMFMVEKRVLPKLKELFNAVNVVCENKSEPELVVESTCLSADEIESSSDEFLASIRTSVD